MPETPTFGRYAEIPYDQMTPEQKEGYQAMIEARGRLPGPSGFTAGKEWPDFSWFLNTKLPGRLPSRFNLFGPHPKLRNG